MLKPVIKHLGHAGFRISGDHGVLVTDPWFNGALLESWFPWPDNSGLAGKALGSWVYVSHHHEDHFDAAYLRAMLKITPEVQVIVPRFRSRRMERLWKGLGVRQGQMHVLGHGAQLELAPGVTVTMLLDRSHKEDSALLLDHHGYRFLDMNDCELAAPDIPRADALACQFSGAFWYPQCYDYDRLTYVKKAAEVRQNNIQRLYRKMETAQATTYYPSAGPAAFLDTSLRQFNSGEHHGDIFPGWRDVEGQFLRRFPRARIGDHLPITESVESYSSRRWEDWDKYYHRDNTAAGANEVAEHFKGLCQGNGKLLQGYAQDVVLGSLTDDWNIRIGVVSGELEEAPSPSYWIRMPRRVMRAVLNGDTTWETALSSMRCELHRDPDQYDFTLMSLLSFGDEPAITTEIARARDARSAERIVRGGFEFQRWCPHAGEDLSGAGIDASGIVTCPRHGWRWDLATGECVNQDRNVTITSRRTG